MEYNIGTSEMISYSHHVYDSAPGNTFCSAILSLSRGKRL
jgi:hypothetical protein